MSSSTPTETESSVRRGSSCPYAAALHADEKKEGDSNNPSSATTPATPVQACPAFESGSCPFKDAKSTEDVREMLVQIPASHLKEGGKFYAVLKELHTVHVASEEFSLPGGCPVQPLIRESVSFTNAMEDFSLAAIMTRLAQEHRRQQRSSSDDESIDEDEENEKVALVAQTLQQQQESPARSSLSVSLKTGTAESHKAAEDVHFVSNFVRGKIDRNLYGQMVAMLYHVYQALEQELDVHAPKHFGSCHFPNELKRTEALKNDVDFWHHTPPPMSPATRDYVNRIHEIAHKDPLLLLAHSYTRYLGDLSGGTVLARVARRALQLDQDGLDFYKFDNIQSPKKFKDKYRESLDSLPLTQEQVDRVVGEANVAFCLNMRLFEELDVMGGVPGATVRPLEDALAFAGKASHDENAECPFAKVAKNAKSSAKSNGDVHKAAGGRCPWPFILAHDPVEGLRDWKTWATIGVAMCWIWSRMNA